MDEKIFSQEVNHFSFHILQDYCKLATCSLLKNSNYILLTKTLPITIIIQLSDKKPEQECNFM